MEPATCRAPDDARARGAAAGGLRRAAALLVALASGCGADVPPSAILITIDTMRADALGATRGAGVTPHLDRLARESTLFESAYATAPITLPSHASMLTGLYPPRHTLRDNGLWALPGSASTLAEQARAAGLATAAFLGAVVLDRAFGLDQGFDRYDVPEHGAQASSQAAERSADEVVLAALGWLQGDRPRGRGFFLWLHVFDPHAPYLPPPAFRQGALAQSPYLGEVAHVDAALGRFLDALRAEGLLASTTVLVVGDHGESLGEQGLQGHGTHCFESTLRVPLLLRPADDLGAVAHGARRERSIVSVADVCPTLLDALGLAPPGDLDGRSLFAPDPERGVYFESYSGYLSFGWSPIAGWVDPRGKYVHSSAPELYDVARDPGEAHDLARERDASPYRQAIAAVVGRPALEPSGADPALLDDLRSLGYAAVPTDPGTALPSPLAPNDLPPPRATIAEHAEFLRAMDLTNLGRAAEAEERLRALLAANPGNRFALDLLAFNLNALGRTAEAAAAFEALVREDGPPWPNAWRNLGQCYRELGRTEDALRALERAAELEPRDPRSLRALRDVLRAAGRDAGAIEARLARIESAG